ncbi:GNAT family N-acetyltransferase [Yoonia sp. 2307UL14-13]|uniref:GNAT family N-acetyltransferase n=1 Tax=Yoonia sp. 2307UL14-13 TaxID=3126506 RepID=UPI0030A11CA2
MPTNAQGQPIGADVPGWDGARDIPYSAMHGHFCDVAPLDMTHGPDLFTAYSADTTGTLWTYMPTGPFDDIEKLTEWLQTCCASRDPLFFAIIDKQTSKAVGVASFLRIKPKDGVVEVGYIAFAPALQKTAAATEAMYLMMRHVFDLGYRRYEWKCDALNAASQAAAKRLGFHYDGLFRQALVYKGRNRDTAWFSILDRDWPRIKHAFEQWLDPSNFDDHGQQIRRLSDWMPTDLQT